MSFEYIRHAYHALYTYLRRWKRKISSRIGIRSGQIVEIEGIRIRLQSGISPYIAERIQTSWYESAELQILKSTLDHTDIVLEIGTGLGFLSTYCAKKIGGENVFTFEANIQMKPIILDTFKLNDSSPNYKFCILGNNIGSKKFYISRNFWESSIIRIKNYEYVIDVPVKSFNLEKEIIKPTYLIMDIEGGEYELLKFADLSGINKILIEIHKDLLDENQISTVEGAIIDAGLKLNKQLSGSGCYFYERSLDIHHEPDSAR